MRSVAVHRCTNPGFPRRPSELQTIDTQRWNKKVQELKLWQSGRSSSLTTLIPRSEGQLTLSYAFKAHWDVHAAWTIALADHRIMQFYDVPDSVLMPAVTLAEEISPVPCGPVILLGYSVSEEKVEAREFCS